MVLGFLSFLVEFYRVGGRGVKFIIILFYLLGKVGYMFSSFRRFIKVGVRMW